MKSVKILMGMAVAALLAASCAKIEVAPAEQNPSTPAKGQAFSIVAKTDATKTTNNDLSTVWAENDKLTVFHAVAEASSYSSNDQFTFSENSTFTGTLTEPLDNEESYDWYAIYPYNSNYTTPANTTCYQTISKNQTQTGYDSKAHLCGSNFPLVGKVTNVSAATTPNISMKQVCAVVEIEVTNNSGDAITITSASITSTKVNLAGGYFINFSGEDAVLVDENKDDPSKDSFMSKTVSLTVSGGTTLANGATASLFIGMKPFTANDETLTLSVNGYNKSLVIPAKDVKFSAGKIKKIAFNYDKSALDVSGTYNKITSMGDLESGDYIIVGEKTSSSFGIFTYGNPDVSNRLAYTQAYTSEGAIPASITDPETNQVWTLAVDGSNVTIYSKFGENYLKANSGLSFGATGTTFTASAESNMFEFKASSTYLGVNKSSNYWRDYASSTLTQTNGLVLFKKADSRTALDTPEAIVVDNEVTWDAVSNAASYNVKIGGKTKEGVTGTNYTFDNNDFSLEAGYYSVSVVAVPSNTELYKNSDAGEASGKVKVGTPKLAQPVLSKGEVTDAAITVTWDADANATNGYYCTISPAAAAAQTVNAGTVTFSGLTAETEYTITVYAIATTGAEALAQSDNGAINVTTASAGGKQYTLTISSITYSGANSYANCAGDRTYTAKAEDNSEMEVTVNFTDVCNGSSGNAGKLQFKKSTGCVVNVTDLGTVNSVTVDGSFTTEKNGGNFSVSNRTSGALYSTVTIVFTK